MSWCYLYRRCESELWERRQKGMSRELDLEKALWTILMTFSRLLPGTFSRASTMDLGQSGLHSSYSN